MAALNPPTLQRLESERFRVLPLWSWSLAAAEYVSAGTKIIGLGFDPRRDIARIKACSEAAERYVYDVWSNTGTSPFTGEACQPPPAASGFAAHPDRAYAENRAFLEWRERAALCAAHEGRLKLGLTPLPEMGLLFRPGLAHVGCNLTVYLSARSPFFAFALGSLDQPGAIFGSACRPSASEAVESAISECLRKIAYLRDWRERSQDSDPFLRAVNYWLSPQGLDAAVDFTKKVVIPSADIDELPGQLELSNLHALRLGELWVCHYWDRRYPLPEVGKGTPLV